MREKGSQFRIEFDTQKRDSSYRSKTPTTWIEQKKSLSVNDKSAINGIGEKIWAMRVPSKQ